MSDIVPHLGELADKINTEHAAALTAARACLEHARNAGQLLLQAKDQCGHGQWLPWLEKNVRFSDRTAQVYMRVAKRWPELQAKAQTTADLTIEDGLKLLAAPAEKIASAPDLHRQPDVQCVEHVNRQHGEPNDPTLSPTQRIEADYSRRRDEIDADRDQHMGWLFVLSGWPSARIAGRMGKSEKWIEHILRYTRFLSFCAAHGDSEVQLLNTDPLPPNEQKSEEEFDTQLQGIEEEYARRRVEVSIEARLAMKRLFREQRRKKSVDEK